MTNLIELEQLALLFGEQLGDDYMVWVESDFVPDPNGKTVVTLHASRVPFAVEWINNETIEITLDFRVASTKQAAVLRDINNLIGAKKINWTVGNNRYSIGMYLSLNKPITGVEIDSGNYMQTFEVTGTMLVFLQFRQ